MFYRFTLDPQEAQRFFELHGDTIRGSLVFMGSPQEDADRDAVHETYRDHLRRLGLLRATYKKPKKGELPEWDLKTGSDKIIPLGWLLLWYIDADPAIPSRTG
jgi:hypothetical protein